MVVHSSKTKDIASRYTINGFQSTTHHNVNLISCHHRDVLFRVLRIVTRTKNMNRCSSLQHTTEDSAKPNKALRTLCRMSIRSASGFSSRSFRHWAGNPRSTVNRFRGSKRRSKNFRNENYNGGLLIRTTFQETLFPVPTRLCKSSSNGTHGEV